MVIQSAKKKKILFIHPLGVNWKPGEEDMSRIANIMAPIGLLSLSAWLEKHGFETEIHDSYAFPGRNEKIYRRLRNNPPDFIGFSTTTSSFLDGVRIAEKAKEILPDVKIVFGGVHISALRERLLYDYPVIDYGVVGEGEETLLELMECDGAGLGGIKGLIYRDTSVLRGTTKDEEEVKFNGFREKLLDMDVLPFPAYHKLQGFPHSYKLPIFNYPGTPNTTMITSRGCPFQCSYCDRSVFRRSYRFNSPQYMFDMITYLHKTYNIRHVNTYDDTFTLKRERIIEFAELMIRSNTKVTFNCAARAEQIDLELLRLMKKAGCWMISLGIETGDPELLQLHRFYPAYNGFHDPLEMIREKIKLIKKAGIRAKGLFMLGLPGETEESIDRSMEYVFSLPLDEFNLAKFTPFPGAPLYNSIRNHGSFEEKWELMNALNFVFVPKGFTKERLEERYQEFYRRYFSRPPVLLGYLAMIWRSPDSWVRFLRNLPSFFRFTKGYRKK